MSPLKLARYRFTLRVLTPLRLPDYAGSALRGAFGHALRQINCVTKAKDCKGCPVIAQCPYAQVFAPHEIPREALNQNVGMNIKNQIPVPYIIEAPLASARTYQSGETITFDMVLMGNALEHLAVIILAWRRAFLRGIGHGDGTAELISILQQCPASNNANTHNSNPTIYTEDKPVIADHITEFVIPEFTQTQDVHLQLLTPLRIEQKGKVFGPRDLNAAIFLRHLIRRVTGQINSQSPTAFPMDKIHALNILADQVQDERRLTWQEWERYSSRQKQIMPLGGVVGRWYLKQVPPPLLSLLVIGEWLHVGKETSFGLGFFKITQDAWQPSVLREQEMAV
jgi:hypothetical protein